MGKTLGRWVMRQEVLGPEGGHPPLARVVARKLIVWSPLLVGHMPNDTYYEGAEVLAAPWPLRVTAIAFPLSLGSLVLMAIASALDPTKRAPHDRLTATRVVQRVRL